MNATINLFNALPLRDGTIPNTRCIFDNVMKKTLNRGFVFSDVVMAHYTEQELLQIADDISLTPEQMNSSFHKSWRKVRDAGIEQLVIEQIVHYITTYGFEQLGMHDNESVYIPAEMLGIPSVDTTKLNLLVIKGFTKPELKSKLMRLLQTGIALGDNTIADVLDVAGYVGVDAKDVDMIKNKEVKIALYDYLGVVPNDPVEFLRYAVFKCTGKTLLIKNDSMIEAIKEGKDVSRLFYNNWYRLPEIFNRFKPIFLAFRANDKLRPTINRIGKLSKTQHKPMESDYLNDLTASIERGDTIEQDELIAELANANIFRKIRLAYALNYRSCNPSSIMYRVRNGKSYATEFDFKYPLFALNVLDTVIRSIVVDLDVNGKKIFIPEYMHYALPATEKQFTGNFPSGSYIAIPNDMVVGIHWNDVDANRIDLDLSIISEDEKIGWDSWYRNVDRTILFSGDITAAPDGASELLYVARQSPSEYILLVNYYNYNDKIEVPFKIVVAKEHAVEFGANYMVDPNNVMSVASSTINQRQKVLGILSVDATESRFYFAESDIGRTITSSNSEFVTHARKYLTLFYENAIGLKDVLEMGGAVMVDSKEDCDIDLSPEVIDKGTIIDLLTS